MLSRNLLIASAATATIVGATGAQALEIRGTNTNFNVSGAAFGVASANHITGQASFGGPNSLDAASRSPTKNVFIGS